MSAVQSSNTKSLLSRLPRQLPVKVAVALLIAVCVDNDPVSAFEWNTGNRPPVNRRAIAGLWKLTTLQPLKEFTVYPKPSSPATSQQQQQHSQQPYSQDDPTKNTLLLMLKEDGSFQQYQEESDVDDLDASWSHFTNKRKSRAIVDQMHQKLLKGTWDYHDGKLTLAAERVDASEEQSNDDAAAASSTDDSTPSLQNDDTVLTGQVIATYETRLQDNPALTENESAAEESDAPKTSASSNTVALDTHLSVPQGNVQVGRFFYPRQHPSFFEQPIYRPTQAGTVALQQVLGSLNTCHEAEEEHVEKFDCRDFFDKTFLLTSHPIGYRRKRSKMGMLEKEKDDETRNLPQANIRVLQVQFHANRTFSTLAGMGDQAVLRGKFDIIGKEKDQLWMQIWRFGFGRSVSGSVYSEGRMLSHEDAKTYWGTIQYQQHEKGEHSNANSARMIEAGSDTNSTDNDKNELADTPLEVNGSVMIGWGIEPVPEARFIMREVVNEEELLDTGEEDEEDDKEEIVLRNLELQSEEDALGDGGIDWDDAGFQ